MSEVDETVITILRSFSMNEDVVHQYVEKLQDEEITSLEDLADLDSTFLVEEIKMKKLHAQKLVRKCQRITLKIALAEDDNVIGCVRSYRGTTIYSLRKSIKKDELPVEQQFVFVAHGTEITDAQESSWDVEQLLDCSNNDVIVIKYKDVYPSPSSEPPMSVLNFESHSFQPPNSHLHDSNSSSQLVPTGNYTFMPSSTLQYDSPKSSFSDSVSMLSNTSPGHLFTGPVTDDFSLLSFTDHNRQSTNSPVFTDNLPEIANNFTDLSTHDFSAPLPDKHSDSKVNKALNFETNQNSSVSPFKRPLPEYKVAAFDKFPLSNAFNEVNETISDAAHPFKVSECSSWAAVSSKHTEKSQLGETSSDGYSSWHWSRSNVDSDASKYSERRNSHGFDSWDFDDDDVAVRELSQQLTETLSEQETTRNVSHSDPITIYSDNNHSTPSSNNEISQIWISKLDNSVTTASVLALAETCGRVCGIQRQTVSYVFVAYELPDIARLAVNKLNGITFAGRKIKVNLTKYNSEYLVNGGEMSTIRHGYVSHRLPTKSASPSSSTSSPRSQPRNTYRVATSRLVLSNVNPSTLTDSVKTIVVQYGTVVKVVRNSHRRITVFFKDPIEAKKAALGIDQQIIDRQVITAQQVEEDVQSNTPAMKSDTKQQKPALLPLPNTGRRDISDDELATIKRTVVALKDTILDQSYVRKLQLGLIVDQERMQMFCMVIVQEAIHHPVDYTKVCRRLDSLNFQVVVSGKILGLKRVLLTQCQQFFMQILEDVKATQGHLSGIVFDHEIGVVTRSKAFVQLRGLLQFLAELYMQRFIPGSILVNSVDVLLEGSHLCCLLNVHALLVNVGRHLCQENVEAMDRCFLAIEGLSRKYVLPAKVKDLMQDLCERRKFGFRNAVR